MNENANETGCTGGGGDWPRVRMTFYHKNIQCTKCGGRRFTIWLGDYEVHAVCTKCRRDEVIYDG